MWKKTRKNSIQSSKYSCYHQKQLLHRQTFFHRAICFCGTTTISDLSSIKNHLNQEQMIYTNNSRCRIIDMLDQIWKGIFPFNVSIFVNCAYTIHWRICKIDISRFNWPQVDQIDKCSSIRLSVPNKVHLNLWYWDQKLVGYWKLPEHSRQHVCHFHTSCKFSCNLNEILFQYCTPSYWYF